jgi:hypothetical protein
MLIPSKEGGVGFVGRRSALLFLGLKLKKFLGVGRAFSTVLLQINYLIGEFLDNSLEGFHVCGINILLIFKGLVTVVLVLRLALSFEDSTPGLPFRLNMSSQL